MNIKFQLKPFHSLRNIGFFLMFFLLGNTLVKAQCLPDPAACVPNPSVSQLSDTVFICEGITSVLLNPQIAGGTFRWFKESSPNNYDPAGSAISLANISVVGNYYLCHQVNNLGCYNKFKVVVANKSLANQLIAEKEFDRPMNLFICSGQAKPFFNTGGNTAKYTYSWTPASLFAGSSNIKNAKYTTTYPKGALSVGSFKPTLIIKEKSSNCSSSKLFTPIVYPPPNPEFGDLKSSYCQNKSEDLSVRVFTIKNYKIASATIKIGTDPAVNLTTTDFTKIPSSQLLPNTLGEVTPPSTVGKQLNSATILIDEAKKSISSTATGPIPVTFTMVTDSGCTASVSTTFTVNPSSPYTVETGAAKKKNFCISDPREGPLESQPTGTGTFSSSGSGVEKDATDQKYYFYPSKAGAGSHTITFTVTGTGCDGGGSVNVNVRPAPKPKLVGREIVCLGVKGIEYKDTCKFATPKPTKTWEIKNTSGVLASGIPFARYPDALSDSIKVDFPSSYSELDLKALIIATNNDAGCSASDTIIVTLNPLVKSPQPIGDIVFCKGSSPTVTATYKSGSLSSPNFIHKWKVVGGSLIPAGSESYQVNVAWDITAPSHRIWVRDSSTTVNTCFIDSRDLTIDFINAPTAVIANFDPISECAGTLVTLSVTAPQAGVTYKWSPFNLTGSSVDITVPPYSEGPSILYTLSAKIANCPEQQSTKNLNIKPTPGDPIPLDVIEHCFDDDKELDILTTADLPGGVIHEWTNHPEVGSAVTFPADTSGIYEVKVTSLITNCSNTGSVEVIDLCNAKFFLPAAFSPNGDFVNDSLEIFGNHFTSFDLKIFSRWGEVIFSTTNPKKFWDGNYAGMPMPQGTYPYSAKYESINAKKKKVTDKKDGSVSLIR